MPFDFPNPSAKASISEALIWASLAAAAIKRLLAHAAEHLLEGVISTRKASMPSAYAFPELFRALRYGDGPLYRGAFLRSAARDCACRRYWSQEEIVEICVPIVLYAGFPAGKTAVEVANEVFREA